MLDIHEVYQYNVTQYDTASGEEGLFVEYINTFLKLKAEANGYPIWVRSPSDEECYIADFQQNEGIIVNKDSIRKNASKRGLAKLCLNSLWGKLCENPMRTQPQLISEPQDLYRFLATPGTEVSSLLFAGDSVCWISWRHANEAHAPVLRHTNDFIASYVTAGENEIVHVSAATRALRRHRQRSIYSAKRWRVIGGDVGLPWRYGLVTKSERIHI